MPRSLNGCAAKYPTGQPYGLAAVGFQTDWCSSEAYEFYRSASAGEGKDQTAAALLQTFDRMVTAQTQMITTLGASVAESVQKAVSAAVAAAMAPLVQVTDRVAQMAKEETGRADEMTKALFKQTREQQPQPDVFDGLAKVIPAGAMALKAIKDLKN